MTDLTEFQQRAVAVAVVKMLSCKHFSICELDALAKTLNRQDLCAGRDYSALRGLHCVDWADMGPELTRMTREKCLEILGLPPQVIDAFERPVAPEQKPERAKSLRLAFWKR
jgi:hypothetical protein